jgi:DNA polymerase-4
LSSFVSRWVFHVDLDEFIAAVEVLRHPELAGVPVVVGGDGDPAKRGVVSTASYEARKFGIRSGMPLRTAYRKNPDAVFLPVDADEYLEASRDVMETLRSFPAVVQVAGWDEAYMAAETDEPEAFAREVQQAVLERTGLWSTIGVGDNKLRAKIAAGFGKPRGVFVLTASNWVEVMGGLSTDALHGIGRKTASKLESLGIRTVAQLGAADEDVLARRFGPNTGPWLRALASGEDASEVTSEPYVARGHGRERTFQRDLTDLDEIRDEVRKLAREVTVDIEKEGRPAIRITVKVRYAPFFTSTHSVTADEPTSDPEVLEALALRALEWFELDRPIRLLGVRAEMQDPSESEEVTAT